jgi:hypothetical protein
VVVESPRRSGGGPYTVVPPSSVDNKQPSPPSQPTSARVIPFRYEAQKRLVNNAAETGASQAALVASLERISQQLAKTAQHREHERSRRQVQARERPDVRHRAGVPQVRRIIGCVDMVSSHLSESSFLSDAQLSTFCLPWLQKSPVPKDTEMPRQTQQHRPAASSASRSHGRKPAKTRDAGDASVISRSEHTDKAAAAAIRHVLARDFEFLKQQVAAQHNVADALAVSSQSTSGAVSDIIPVAAAAASASGKLDATEADRVALEKELANLEHEFALLDYLNSQ